MWGRLWNRKLLIACMCLASAGAPVSVARGREKITILRDEFGVPHIFAETPAGAAFGSGYAQAEDRLEEMMRNYRKAEGTMSEVFGESWFRHDYLQRVFRHRQVAEQHYSELNPKLRAVLEAFEAGVRRFIEEHPEQLPTWAPKLEPWQPIALGRFIMWGWPLGEASGALRRAGVDFDPVPYHGSNEWLLAPSKTAAHAPIALIDPHLTWYGEFRFYELRVYGGELAYSGAAIVGFPLPSLGHSRYTSVAMTTGGPHTSDIFEEEISDGKYRFRDAWRPLEVRHEKIGVKVGDRVEWREITIESTHHGPIVAHKSGKAYAMATPYADEFRMLEEAWAMETATNLAEMKQALALRQIMAQNIMVGTVDGDIYYVRNGRVPVRPKGCDPSKPMRGSTGECEWQGIHPFEDLVQIANPPQGYMQNCNVSPYAMMKDSSLVPEKYVEHPYLYNAGKTPAHQRAAMMVDLLEGAHNVTVDQALGMAFSTEVYKADEWQTRVRETMRSGGESSSEAARLILDWNRHSDQDSRGALAFYLFKMALGEQSRAVEPSGSLSDADLRDALRQAEARLQLDFASPAAYGTLFRVGRQGASRTYPVSGGSLLDAGMATPRAIGFDKIGKEMVGRSGQTSTQIVILTKPPQSFMVIPLGESDHPNSAHFDDQAEKLFSPGRAKPTYFLNRKELEKHVTVRKELSF